MNRLQILAVLLGLAIFAGGVLLAVWPVQDGSGGGLAVRSPLVEPLQVWALRPGGLLLPLGICALGVAIAVVGCLLADRRR